MSICANPNYDGCQNLTGKTPFSSSGLNEKIKKFVLGIFDIPSIVLPNIVPDINNRVNCVRQIMCNVTQAIVTDISTRGFFSKREVVLKIDDNVIFRVVTGLLPSCDVGSSATARHRAIGIYIQ